MDMTGRIQKVKYLNAKNDGDFRSLALDITAQLQTIHNPSELEKWIDAGTGAICAATALKHDTWSYEDEGRLTYVQRRERPQDESAGIPISRSPDAKPVFWRQPSERIVGGEAVKYFDFPFGRFQK